MSLFQIDKEIKNYKTTQFIQQFFFIKKQKPKQKNNLEDTCVSS